MNGTEILAVFLVALFSLLMVGVPIAFGLVLVSAVLLLYTGKDEEGDGEQCETVCSKYHCLGKKLRGEIADGLGLS